MKWAVCLSGHLRTWRANARSFRRFVQKPYNADVFIHTWSTMDFTARTFWRGPLEHVERVDEPAVIEAELARHYNLKGFRIEEQIDFMRPEFEDWNRESDAQAENVVSNLYSANQSYKLLVEHEKASGIKYDMIVKTRPDLRFFNRRHLQPTPHDGIHAIRQPGWEAFGSVGDLFNFGPAEQMAVIFGFYDRIHDYLKPEYFCGKKIVPEALMHAFLRDVGLEVRNIDMVIGIDRWGRSQIGYPCLKPLRVRLRRRYPRLLRWIR
jgi:hypothetical protein